MHDFRLINKNARNVGGLILTCVAYNIILIADLFGGRRIDYNGVFNNWLNAGEIHAPAFCSAS